MRERLLAVARGRRERFAASQDPAVVLAPATLTVLAALLRSTPDPASDLDVAHAAGMLHWFRYLALEPGADQQDLTAALRLLKPVYLARPEALPYAVRDLLRDDGNVLFDVSVAVAATADMLQQALTSGESASLDRAINVLRQSLKVVAEDHSERAGMLSNLALALRVRFERTGGLTDLDAAVAVCRAVALVPAGYPEMPGVLVNLADALRTRSVFAGKPADLDEAVAVSRKAVALAPAAHPGRALALSNLGVVLQARFDQTRRIADLDEAAAMAQEAVDASPAGDPDRAARLTNLSLVLRARSERNSARPGGN